MLFGVRALGFLLAGEGVLQLLAAGELGSSETSTSDPGEPLKFADDSEACKLSGGLGCSARGRGMVFGVGSLQALSKLYPRTGACPFLGPGSSGKAFVGTLGAEASASGAAGPAGTLGAEALASSGATGPVGTLGAEALASSGAAGPAGTLGAEALASSGVAGPVGSLGPEALASSGAAGPVDGALGSEALGAPPRGPARRSPERSADSPE